MMKPSTAYMDCFDGNDELPVSVAYHHQKIEYQTPWPDSRSYGTGLAPAAPAMTAPAGARPPAPDELPIPKLKWLEGQITKPACDDFQDMQTEWKALYLRESEQNEGLWPYQVEEMQRRGQLMAAPTPFVPRGFQEEFSESHDKSRQWQHFEQIFKPPVENNGYQQHPAGRLAASLDAAKGGYDNGSSTTSGEEAAVAADLQSPIRGQLRKTKMCAFFQKSRCAFGEMCSFAHSPDELQATPDFIKTKLCYGHFRGCCYDPMCTFAHGYDELKESENAVTNTRELCYWSTLGYCKSGATCRYAHDMVELNRLATSEF